MKILGIGNAIVDVICKIDDGFLNSVSSTSFIVLLVSLFSDRKLSSILHITSIIALPIPRTFISSFLSNNFFFSIWVTAFTNFAR